MSLGDRLKEKEDDGSEAVLGVGESLSGNKTAVFRVKKVRRM